MEEWWWGEFVKKNTGLGWIEINWWIYGFKKFVDMKEPLCMQNYSHQVFNILVLEFEYALKYTLLL